MQSNAGACGCFMQAESEAVKISAIKELLDRAYGKPQPAVEPRSEEHRVNVITLVAGVREEINPI